MHVLKTLFEFIVFTVIVKAIIAHWLAQKILEWVTKENARNMAIWQHWVNWAKGKGHAQESVLNCNDGACATF